MSLLPALLLQLAASHGTALAGPPYGVGEILEYEAQYNVFRPGSARLAVLAIDTVRGMPSWRFQFNFDVSILRLFTNHSEFTSWTGVTDFSSHRFVRVINENGRLRQEDFAIYADSGFYRAVADTTIHATSRVPMDDVAFFYFLRTTPLMAGQIYHYDRYWRAAQNPVTVEVVRRQTMTLPDGSKAACLVLHPIVDSPKGMFSRRSRALLWITDDARRYPVRIESTYPFGTVRLVLTRIVTPRTDGAP